jgi:hypothetical protein
MLPPHESAPLWANAVDPARRLRSQTAIRGRTVSTNVSASAQDWEELLAQRIPLFGHRNWIVVADYAYPAQSNPGIETITTGTGHIEVLEKTLKAIAECKHIRARVLLDAELRLLSEADAPGVSTYRQELGQLLGNRSTCELDHEQIISKLDRSGSLFRILILKSTLTIPYTSVFLELDCGYWNTASESRLRNSLKHASKTLDMSPTTDLVMKIPRFSGPFSARRNS